MAVIKVWTPQQAAGDRLMDWRFHWMTNLCVCLCAHWAWKCLSDSQKETDNDRKKKCVHMEAKCQQEKATKCEREEGEWEKDLQINITETFTQTAETYWKLAVFESKNAIFCGGVKLCCAVDEWPGAHKPRPPVCTLEPLHTDVLESWH